ncbi:MAG: hypothetical protein BWY80_00883 [Firmicutes bacterium ADurb.Bin456]|nr:MAG: hypothetical protein BWY80_00883 [Firmicutes bacterium ADurb.Bin456]
MPDPVIPFIPGMEFVHKPGVGGVKCAVCGERPEYREANEHIRLHQKIGPFKAVWLCPDCHRKYKLGEPDPEPEQPQEVPPDQGAEPAGGLPEQSRSEIKRDQNLEDRDQKRPEAIPESPVSENTGPEPALNGPEPENNGTETGPTPPKQTPQEYRPRGEYTIPDVLGDVSLGIERDAVGFVLTFYRNGGKVGSHTTKTPPWLSPKVVTDTGAALLKVCPDLPYNKEHVRDTLTEVFKEVERAITDNPQAAALLLPPAVSHVLGRVDRVAITLFKDGLGGGEPVYELFTGQDEENDPRTVTLSLGDMVNETAGMFKRRWSAVFVSDFLELNKTDWVTLRAALIDRAEVREAEHTGEGDFLISDLLTELSYRTFTTWTPHWKADPKAYLLCEHTPDGWVIFVYTGLIVSFLENRDRPAATWSPKLSKELKRRGLTVGNAKTVRVGTGTGGTVRVWTFTGDALGFHEDMLVDPPKPDPVVTGETFVTGENAPHPSHAEKEGFTEQEPGGV